MDRRTRNLGLLNLHIIVLILYTAAAILSRTNAQLLLNATIFLNQTSMCVISTCLHE